MVDPGGGGGRDDAREVAPRADGKHHEQGHARRKARWGCDRERIVDAVEPNDVATFAVGRLDRPLAADRLTGVVAVAAQIVPAFDHTAGLDRGAGFRVIPERQRADLRPAIRAARVERGRRLELKESRPEDRRPSAVIAYCRSQICATMSPDPFADRIDT